MADRIESIVSLAKRRGFVFASSEIYGGTRSAWDYGPLGVELKDNIRRQWWRSMVQERDNVVGLDSAVILAKDVWAASGHLGETLSPALDELRCGDVGTAFAAYRDHGRVVIGDEAQDVHALVLADWHTAWTAGQDVLLLAGTRSEARLLNRYARQILVAQGELDLAGDVQIVFEQQVVVAVNRPADRVLERHDAVRGAFPDHRLEDFVERLTWQRFGVVAAIEQRRRFAVGARFSLIRESQDGSNIDGRWQLAGGL